MSTSRLPLPPSRSIVSGLPKVRYTILRAASLMALLIGNVANADELTLAPVTLPPTKTPWAAGTGLDIPQFDPKLGTLQSVDLSVVSQVYSQGTFSNSSDFEETAFVTVTSTQNVVIPGQQPAQLSVTAVGLTETIGPFETVPSLTPTGRRTKAFPFTAGLGPFIGTGKIHVDLSDQTKATLTGASSVRYLSPSNKAGLAITTTYTYSGQTRLEITSQTLSADGSFLELTVAGQAGASCRLDGLSAITEPPQPWSQVAKDVIPPSGSLLFRVRHDVASGQKFFRAVVP